LRSFYADLFGWAIDTRNPFGYGIVEREGVGIGGGIGATPLGMTRHLTFYVQVADVEAALAEAEKLGGMRLTGVFEVQPAVELAQFRDPDGNVVGLLSDRA
jgi:uncharacterized protein